jgi:Tfp pilus assembly protein PilF
MTIRLLLTLALFMAGTSAWAAGSDPVAAPAKPPGEYEFGVKAVKSGDYRKALGHLEKALAQDMQDPDTLNYMGYSYRKLKQFDKALETYQKALAIKPDHRGANEYIGELYLETGQLEKAKERLKVLDSACFFGCEEYTTLKKAIAAYEQKQK